MLMQYSSLPKVRYNRQTVTQGDEEEVEDVNIASHQLWRNDTSLTVRVLVHQSSCQREEATITSTKASCSRGVMSCACSTTSTK